ncbi:MAG: polysaccharide export protein [Deltaproteobacteria bacterium]|nr:polysaccharide export protein [Deltaproteobacteria bacterium]
MRPLLALIAILLLAGACADNPPATYPTVAPFDPGKLALGPGDKLALTVFYGSKEIHATYTLDSSGTMEVQYIGSVSAGGKGLRQVQEDIQKRLADGYLQDPVVSLTVTEINSLKCSVFGQVGRSGSIKFTPGLTITEAIAQSGGFQPLARKNMVRVTRLTDGRKETYKIPVEMIAEGRRPNFPMMPGDEIFVPERPW